MRLNFSGWKARMMRKKNKDRRKYFIIPDHCYLRNIREIQTDFGKHSKSLQEKKMKTEKKSGMVGKKNKRRKKERETGERENRRRNTNL